MQQRQLRPLAGFGHEPFRPRHQSFNDKGSLVNDPTLAGDPTPVSRAQSQTIRACTLSFFDKYLKNQDDHLLDNPAAAYANIINFQKK